MHNGLIRATIAAEVLGIDISALCVSQKYKQFYHKTDNRRESYFDIGGYKTLEGKKESLLEKTKLFIEYLRYEEKLTYKEMSKAGIHIQALHRHDFSFEKAFSFARWFAINRPFFVKRFDEYYEWKPKYYNRVVNFKKEAKCG